MNQSLFESNFINKQHICEYFGNVVLLATDYLGETVLIFCNGEILTYQLIQQKQWVNTSLLKVTPQPEILSLNDYRLQLSGNGRKFFLLQVDDRHEFNVSIWHRGHKAKWIFQQSLKLISHSSFMSINLSGDALMIRQSNRIILWEFNQPQTKIARRQSLPFETYLAYFNENNNVIAAKVKNSVALLKKLNCMWVKYQNIKTEQVAYMQFYKNKLIIMSHFLQIYKMNEQLHFQLDKKINSKFFNNEPQFCLYMGSIVLAQLSSQDLEYHKLENNVWLQDEEYITGRFEAQQIVQSKDKKKLFFYRKRFGGIVFEKKNKIKQKIQE
ncbi:unnamed protein product (macronuclear) [Paramecium tetraurelia]|uniref:Uncharacterized protein n=1 Tax=Paramecium tetraurelia TaxID=5888 RepID=A0DMV1_PARTE|nr:uncharacterized protein GSPATT00018572001 [Paramecium tetraurelia]CAK84368.1 unnamed protein product [Paramecium tetraurelia]|eukprot:XP_001451765.1 hypothetical protein (macronuclear) [Paramecium tetraurelia strain d4-2]